MENKSSKVMFEVLCWQMVTFGIIWSAYASTYLLRKPIAIIKSDILIAFQVNPEMLGILDASLLLPYGLVSLFFGSVADKIGPRRTFGYGLLISAIATLPMGKCNSLWQLLVLLAICGASQALCWPAACTLLALWFPSSMRNTVFGVFGTSCFIGGIAGTALTVFMQLIRGWREVFFPAACIAGVLSLFILLFGYDPNYRGLVVLGSTNISSKPHHESISMKSHAIFKSLKVTWKLPLVPEVSASIFCIKAVRYALMMWLPFYLYRIQGYSESTAGLAATAFEIGGAAGSAGMGIIIDKFLSGRALLASSVASGCCGLTLIALMVTASFGPVAHLSWLVVAGALNCGPEIVLAGPVATRLGEHHKATAAVTGIVNGLGSLGTVLEGPVVAIVGSRFGWNALLPLMVVMSALAGMTSYRANKMSLKNKVYPSVSNSSKAGLSS